jgi:hypothetical protein
VGEQHHAPASLTLANDPVLLPNIQDRPDYSVGEGTLRSANQLGKGVGSAYIKCSGP